MCGEIDENTKELKLEFVPVDEKEYAELKLDVTDIASEEELIEKINDGKFEQDKYWKIILTGEKYIDINSNKILKYIVHQNVIKIKDMTKIGIDLNLKAKKNNLEGIFIRKLQERLKEFPEDSEKIYKAIEIGLNAFDK